MTVPLNTLLIANFDSGVGYAWSLIEDFWLAIHNENLKMQRNSIICYPTISTVAEKIVSQQINTCQHDFNNTNPSQILKNIRLIREHNIDTLYITDQKKRNYRYGIYRIFGVRKIIVHDHSPGIRKDRNIIISAIKKCLNYLPFASAFTCNAAFAVSPYITKRLQEVDALPSQNIYEITNGIRIRDFKSKEIASTNINIVSVARLTQYKGIDFSIKALAHISSRVKEKKVHYFIIGDGPELEPLKALTKTLGINDLITFTGKLDHDNVIARLQNCDIAIHPSKGEAMSLAILEYMQSELALLTSDNPSVCSAFQANQEGLTYKENNVDDAAEKLLLLIEDEKLRIELGKMARKKVISHFSDELMMRKFVAAYLKIITA